MPRSIKPSKNMQSSVKRAIHEDGLRALSARTKLHHATLLKVARGESVGPATVQALETQTWTKRKTAGDYDQVSTQVRSPRRRQADVAWPLDKIRAARDAQLRGDFRTSARFGEALLLDDALYTAYDNRVAPLRALGIELASAGGVRGERIQKGAVSSITVPRAVLVGIGGTLALYNVAFGYINHHPTDDGTAINMVVREWPIEHVRWDWSRECYLTTTEGGHEVEITHGDGRWIVFAGAALDPFKKAALLPAALIFAAHVDAIRDWSAASRSHGQAKIIGQLQEGVPVQDENGNLTPDARYFLDMLADLVSGDAGAGLRPANSDVDFLANGSTAWQVFSELASNRGRAAARVFLGTDGTLGSVGGGPGVDIATLFGVATTKLQADVQVIEDALYSGLYVPFTAINFGDSKHAPRLKFLMPDADAKQRTDQLSASRAAMLDAIDRYKSAGLVVTQEVITQLATDYGVPVPQLAGADVATVSIALAPTDVAKVVRVREARASQGLQPFGDYRDDLTITQLETAVPPGTVPPSNSAPTPTQSPQPAA